MSRGLLFACFAMGCTGPEPEPPPGDTDDTDTDTDTEPLSGLLRINEVMADNESTIDGPDGIVFPDWIEIANPGDLSIALSRIRIENGEGAVWEGSEGELEPGARRMLWADAALELGFGIDKENDSLRLFVDGEEADRVDIDDLGGDLSLARDPDLEGAFAVTAWATPNAPNEGTSPSLNAADETVFTDRLVHRIDFTFTQEAYDQIGQGDRPEVHVAMTFDGASLPDVGLKLKGGGSYAPMSGKPAFVVDFNEWVSGTKLRGLKSFKLHNGNVYDPTRVHDYITYQLARDVGLMAPRVGWAEVFCNDQPYGIYMLVERHDDEFIEYFDPEQKDIGVLLEPNKGFHDFGRGALTPQAIESAWTEGPLPPDPAVIDALQAVDALVGQTASDENLELFWQHVDKQPFLAYLAWETLVTHSDGYITPNNWRLFVNGTTHRMQWIPSGAEWTWDDQVHVYQGQDGEVTRWCLQNDSCRHDYSVEVLAMADRVEALDLETQFRDLSVWLDPLIQSDPRYPLWGSVEEARQSTVQHLQENPTNARDEVYAEFPDLVP